MKESRKVYGWLVRDRNAAVGCSSIWTGTRGGENYCGNLLWQSSLTLLFPGCARKQARNGFDIPAKTVKALHVNSSDGTDVNYVDVGVEQMEHSNEEVYSQ